MSDVEFFGVTMRPIPDHPGYLASADGRIWSMRRPSWRGREPTEPRLMKVHVGNRGRYSLRLCVEGKGVLRTVHQLIALTFIGPVPPDKPYVCHNNGMCLDNRAENLRYDDQSGNMADTFIHGTHQRGTRSHRCKLDERNVFNIVALIESGCTQMSVAVLYTVDTVTITNIWTGKNWGWLTGRGIGRLKGRQIGVTFDPRNVMNVVHLYQAGLSGGKIAALYNVSRCPIYRILDGTGWSHVTGLTPETAREMKRLRGET